MREPVEKVIGGFSFRVYMMPPMEAHRALLRLLKMAGPTLGPILTAQGTISDIIAAARAQAAGLVDEATAKPEGDMGWVDVVIRRLSEELSDEFFDLLIPLLRKATDVTDLRREGKLFEDGRNLSDQATFDVLFAGKLSVMYQWLWFAWRAQYQDFFDFIPKRTVTPTTRISSEKVKGQPTAQA